MWMGQKALKLTRRSSGAIIRWPCFTRSWVRISGDKISLDFLLFLRQMQKFGLATEKVGAFSNFALRIVSYKNFCSVTITAQLTEIAKSYPSQCEKKASGEKEVWMVYLSFDLKRFKNYEVSGPNLRSRENVPILKGGHGCISKKIWVGRSKVQIWCQPRLFISEFTLPLGICKHNITSERCKKSSIHKKIHHSRGNHL